jgi:hypothetical protein
MHTKLHLPAFLHALRSFAPHLIHLIDPIWPSVQALALQILCPSTPIVTSHHANLPMYAEFFGWILFLPSFALVLCSPAVSACYLLRCISVLLTALYTLQAMVRLGSFVFRARSVLPGACTCYLLRRVVSLDLSPSYLKSSAGSVR